MKCLTIHQPWATLIMSGKRRFEVRTWSTSYRGPILIHAGLKVEHEECERLNIHNPETGCILGVAKLERVIHFTPTTWDTTRHLHLEKGKMPTPNAFGWELIPLLRLSEPVPYSGKLGLFNAKVVL
jgi:hypothetical protein